MSMEQRVTTLEEITEVLIRVQRDMNAGLQRFRAAQARYEEAMIEFGDILDRQEETIQTLLAYLPITQAEIVRLDNRIDSIEGA